MLTRKGPCASVIVAVTCPPSLPCPTGQNIQDSSEDGESLLSLACSAGYFELAEVLLKMKGSVEESGRKGERGEIESEWTEGGREGGIICIRMYSAV